MPKDIYSVQQTENLILMKIRFLHCLVGFYASKNVDEFEKTNSVNSSQLSRVRSWLQSSGNGKKEQDMS